MQLSQLVKINESALVANAVNFDLMADTEKNRDLCKGFVYNYNDDPGKLHNSTVGVLDALRRSFHSRNEPNIHLMVQDYGKGKSHFALAVANFFRKPADSPEVQGILQQVEYATGKEHRILEGLKAYKKRGNHLVICLSGDKTINLKKYILQQLQIALEADGITDTIASQICQRPLHYLKRLDDSQRQAVEAFLNTYREGEFDLQSLIDLLESNDHEAVVHVREISRHLIGDPLDFQDNTDIYDVLQTIITQLCQGENPRYQGVIFLFDELYNYLQLWSNDSASMGGLTLQEVTNICENFKGKVALLSLSQKRPSNYTPKQNTEDYRRITTRIELKDSTYEPASSLELVLDNLIYQQTKTRDWETFWKRWQNTLVETNTDLYQNRFGHYYQPRQWTQDDCLNHLTVGCFPLHPLTTYLLSNLGFSQGRTALQFIQSDLKEFINTFESEKQGKLNFLYPVSLVDAFEDNFANSDSTNYSTYQKASDAIIASASPEEMTVLKALFLFYFTNSGKNVKSASTQKGVALLKKEDNERHEEILSLLTGMSRLQITKTLDKLSKTREVIYHTPADNTYRFYSGGFGIIDLRKLVKEEASELNPALSRVTKHLRNNLQGIAGKREIIPTEFIEESKLVNDNWLFPCEVYTVPDFKHNLTSRNMLNNKLGIVAYVIANSNEELNQFKAELPQLLTPSPEDKNHTKRRVVVAVATQPVDELALALLEQEILRQKNVQEFGEAVNILMKEYTDQITRLTRGLFKGCTFSCAVDDKIAVSDRTQASPVVSTLLKDLYPFVPPVAKTDKLKLSSTTGNEVIGYAAKRLLEDDLRPQAFPKKSYVNTIDPVCVTAWGILQKTSQKYTVQVPSNSNVKAAWDKLSELTTIEEGKDEKPIDLEELWLLFSQPPYGYNEYTFTLLLACWLAYHRSEIYLDGNFSIPEKKSDPTFRQQELVQNWADTNVFNKPKTFIKDWVLKRPKPRLIRRRNSLPVLPPQMTYEEAEDKLQHLQDYLPRIEAKTPEDAAEYRRKQQAIQTCLDQLKTKFDRLERVEKLLPKPHTISLDQWLNFHRQLQTNLSDVTEGEFTLSPTEDQQTRYENAKLGILDYLEGYVSKLRDRLPTLTSEKDCGAYQQELTGVLQKLQQTPQFPDHLIQQLTTTESKIPQRLQEIKDEQKIKQIRHPQLNQGKTLVNCQENIKQIQDLQKQLHNPKRYQAEIEGKIAALKEQIVKYETQLQESRDRFPKIQTLDEAKTLQTQIFDQGYCYTDSDLQPEYETLRSEITLWVELFQTFDTIKTRLNTLQDCDQQLDILDHWRIKNQDSFTPDLDAKFKEICQQIKDRKNHLQDQKQNEARKWVQQIGNDAVPLHQNSDSDPENTIKIARHLLTQINTEKSQYLGYLNPDMKGTIEYVTQLCQNTIEQDTEKQIEFLFQDLTPQRQKAVLNQLQTRYNSQQGGHHE